MVLIYETEMYPDPDQATEICGCIEDSSALEMIESSVISFCEHSSQYKISIACKLEDK